MHTKIPSRLGRRPILFLLAIAAISANSCSSRGKVSGTVTFDGKPLPAGRITFIGPNDKASDPGNINDGKYEVVNAPIGECKIRVETMYLAQMMGMMPGMGMPGANPASGMTNPSMQRMDPEKKGQMEKANPDLAKMREMSAGAFVEIPDEYENPEKTPLTFTVKSGSNSKDIELVAPPGWKPRMGKK